MINQEKIDFLNRYTLNKNLSVKILNMDEINNIEEDIIPSEWKEVFKEVEKPNKIKKNVGNLEKICR